MLITLFPNKYPIIDARGYKLLSVSMLLYWLWLIKLIIYSPVIIFLSILLALTHHAIVLKFVAQVSWVFQPLTIFLLLPGCLRPGQEPILIKSTSHETVKHLIFITGGNRSLPSEALNALRGTLLPNGKRFIDKVAHGEMLYATPLFAQADQRLYTKTLSRRLLSLIKKNPEIDTISLIGHSLGGGLAIQLALELKKRPETKHLKINLTVNRSFGNLWQAAKIKYSYYGGTLLERMFSCFWMFDNVQGLSELAHTDINVSITQVFPDYMFEPTCYLTSQIKDRPWLPSSWLLEELHIKGEFLKHHEKELHSIPIVELKKLEPSNL